MKFKAEFVKWLNENGVEKAAGGYASRINSIEKVFGDTMDSLDKFIEKEVSKITPKNFPDVTERVLDDYKVALRSYWRFIKDKKAS